ncbi:MAG: shikimate dehydrogenase [SAR324 cluster bacterium]|nr:shikimate dehydrogenase [SAR324 cluster bacterium]
MSGAPPIDGETRLYGILGHPVSHTISPPMHNAAFRALGHNAVYLPFPVPPERLEAAVAGLRSVGVRGLNVTVPHKTAVVPLLAELTPAARAIGAVNTLRLDTGGWCGTNTDGTGFILSLQHDLGWHAEGKRVLMLGAGGAARSIGRHLLQEGAARLTIANRTPERAVALAEAMARDPGGTVECLPLDGLAGAAPDLLVNTTTVGMGDGRAPADLAPVGVREAVIDIVYAPPVTPLLEQARALGLAHTNGLGMLLYQGVAAFEFFTGAEAPVEAMRAALEAALQPPER